MKPSTSTLDFTITSCEASHSLLKIPQNILKKDSYKAGLELSPEYFDCPGMPYHVIEAIAKIPIYRYKKNNNMGIETNSRKCIITHDPSYLQLLESLPKIAKSDAGVFITGETGTGKELIASEIHHLSSRANRPFTTIDCGTREPDILEAELFGHVKGAYTGATTSKAGLVTMSEGGTLFLDELNSTTLKLQSKLIRFLETHTYYPLGSGELQSADVRIIAAANYNVSKAIREGKLREDLYHRLCTVKLHLPPLRERVDDIIPIAEHFVEIFRVKYKMPDATLSDEGFRYLKNHPLTGNVRELYNMVEGGFIIGNNNVINISDIMDKPPITLQYTYEEYSKQELNKARIYYLQSLLTHYKGNVTAAAEHAGQDRSYFYKMLHDNEIDPDNYRRD